MRAHHIHIIGSPGSGKTKFAQKLAKKINYPHIEVDDLFWLPNWQERPLEEFFVLVDEQLRLPKWVFDGNYRRMGNMVYQHADMVIWLDYSFPLTVSRVLKRTLGNVLMHRSLNNGNYESIRRGFFSRKSFCVHTMRTFYDRRKRFNKMFTSQDWAHLDRIRFSQPAQANAWLANFQLSKYVAPKPVQLSLFAERQQL